MEEIMNLLEKNYIEDLKKNELDKFERCKVLESILKRNKWTPYTLAKKINKPKTTVQDWLLYAKISKEKYEKLKTEGFNESDIFRSLRDNRKSKTEEEIKFRHYKTNTKPVELGDMDEDLREAIKKFSGYVLKGKITRDTIDLIIELKTILGKIQARIEMND